MTSDAIRVIFDNKSDSTDFISANIGQMRGDLHRYNRSKYNWKLVKPIMVIREWVKMYNRNNKLQIAVPVDIISGVI